MNENETYKQSIIELQKVSEESEAIVLALDSEDTIIKCESRLDGWDYCYAVAIGLAGVYITSSQKLEEYLADIHKASSDCNGEYDFFQKALGRLLHHKGDYIDKIDATFKNRKGENAYGLFHRLLWGHDILSINKDNPFYLMFQQKGVIGIVQAVRHLLADTLSKQGLPIPGSSFLDFVDENGKTSNYLIKISTMLSEEAFDNKTRAQEIYSHMFTIKGQDLTYSGIVDVLTLLYCKLRGVSDPIRKSEMRLIAFYIAFWGKAIVGMIKQNGIPYISIPLANAMMVEWVRNDYLYRKQIKKLRETTVDIAEKVNALERRNTFINEMIGEDYSSTEKRIGQRRNINKFEDILDGGLNNG